MPITNVHQPSASQHSVSVEIDDVNTNIYSAVERVDISLRQNEHDHVRIVLAGIPAVSVTDYVDRPVMVSLSVLYGEGFTFTGFINHIEPTHKSRDGRVEGGLLQEAPSTVLEPVQPCVGSRPACGRTLPSKTWLR